MFGVNLLPNYKKEISAQQKKWELMMFVAGFSVIFIAAVCLILSLAIGVQGTMMAEQDVELICRSSGKRQDGQHIDCAKYGDKPVEKIADRNILLTTKKQLEHAIQLDQNKRASFRGLNIAEGILAQAQTNFYIDGLKLDSQKNTLTIKGAFNVQQASEWINAERALQKSVQASSMSYGHYMRVDAKGKMEQIPSICVSEKIVNNQVVGVYHKGALGCERELVQGLDTNVELSEALESSAALAVVQDIEIKRNYKNLKEKSEARKRGYFFEEECANCRPVKKINITKEQRSQKKRTKSDPMQHDGQTGAQLQRFVMAINLDARVFQAKYKHMLIKNADKYTLLDDGPIDKRLFAQDFNCSKGGCVVGKGASDAK